MEVIGNGYQSGDKKRNQATDVNGRESVISGRELTDYRLRFYGWRVAVKGKPGY